MFKRQMFGAQAFNASASGFSSPRNRCPSVPDWVRTLGSGRDDQVRVAG